MKQKPVGIKNIIKSWFMKKPKSELALVWMHIYHNEDYGVIGHCIFEIGRAPVRTKVIRVPVRSII